MKLSPSAQQIVLGELHRRAPRRGMRKRLAYELSTTEQGLSSVMLGKRAVPEVLAWRLLAKVRAEELALADKLEAEMALPSLLKERDW
jgi:hypothetical protein